MIHEVDNRLLDAVRQETQDNTVVPLTSELSDKSEISDGGKVEIFHVLTTFINNLVILWVNVLV